eukprot:1735793-Lingulodinium_polyedra.AAC.1
MLPSGYLLDPGSFRPFCRLGLGDLEAAVVAEVGSGRRDARGAESGIDVPVSAVLLRSLRLRRDPAISG